MQQYLNALDALRELGDRMKEIKPTINSEAVIHLKINEHLASMGIELTTLLQKSLSFAFVGDDCGLCAEEQVIARDRARKIEAIKALRTRTGVDLVTAKRMVEDFHYKHGIA